MWCYQQTDEAIFTNFSVLSENSLLSCNEPDLIGGRVVRVKYEKLKVAFSAQWDEI